MGFGPVTGSTLKTALCHIRALVGPIDKYLEVPADFLETFGEGLLSGASPPLYPHFNRPFGLLTLCQVLSGGRQRQIKGGPRGLSRNLRMALDLGV